MMALQLDLFEDVEHLPWYGRSPRSLTRCSMALFLRPEPQKDARFVPDPFQIEIWPVGNRAPRKYRGAPLLKEVKDG